MTTSDLSESTLPRSMAAHAHGGQFQFVEGVHVPRAADIHEAYDLVEAKRNYWVFTINVSAENIRNVFADLVKHVPDPGYFILEVGTSQEQEARIRTKSDDPWHIDVHYLDGITARKAVALFDEQAHLFIHDGRVQVGFGAHNAIDEIYISPYKIFRVFTATPEKYITALRHLGIQQEKQVRTVWKTFTPRAPGRREVLPNSPATVADLLRRLKGRGLYLAERREDVH